MKFYTFIPNTLDGEVEYQGFDTKEDALAYLQSESCGIIVQTDVEPTVFVTQRFYDEQTVQEVDLHNGGMVYPNKPISSPIKGVVESVQLSYAMPPEKITRVKIEDIL